MKLIVAGSRFSDLTAEQLAQLDAIHAEHHVAEVVSGGAEGADRSGELWAESRGIPVRIFKPEWQRYGRAAGPVRNGQMAAHADAAAVFDHVASRHERIDVIGRSLGSAVAARLAATQPVRRLVLVTPFDSIVALAGGLFPFLPVRLLVADRFETIADAPRIAVPTLVITAGRDEVVPAAHTRRLVAAFAPGIATERAFPAAGHNDVSSDPAYLQGIARFLE